MPTLKTPAAFKALDACCTQLLNSKLYLPEGFQLEILLTFAAYIVTEFHFIFVAGIGPPS